MLNVKALLLKVLNFLQTLSYDSGEKTAYGNYCKYRRIGKWVYVWGWSANGWTISSGAYRALTTLPSGYRPKNNHYFWVGAMGGTQQIFGTIQPDGIINFYTTGTTAYWEFSTIFPLD